jgi:hypothetical protein
MRECVRIGERGEEEDSQPIDLLLGSAAMSRPVELPVQFLKKPHVTSPFDEK